MGYPHWLIVVGAVLLVLGIIGLALRPKQNTEAGLKETANGSELGRPDLAPQPNTRKARLAEQKKEKQAKIDGSDGSAERLDS